VDQVILPLMTQFDGGVPNGLRRGQIRRRRCDQTGPGGRPRTGVVRRGRGRQNSTGHTRARTPRDCPLYRLRCQRLVQQCHADRHSHQSCRQGDQGFDNIAITPNGAKAYAFVTFQGNTTCRSCRSARTADGFSNFSEVPIALATGTVEPEIGVHDVIAAYAFTPNSKTVYFPIVGTSRVIPVSVATGMLGTPIRVGANPEIFAVTPDGKTLYVGNDQRSTTIAGTVTPIRTATNTPGKPIKVGRAPAAIAITP
jgi:hypothetical protein